MNKIIKLILLWIICFTATTVSAQQRRISGTVSDDFDVVPGANVVERDKNNRIVSAAVTDMNGNFTMPIKDPNNTLYITFMGLKPWSQKIGTQTVFKVKMQDNTKTMVEFVKTAKKMQQSGGLNIPVRELAGATQTFNMDEMEGMAFESVDQALQGQIAGLDIVQNSGNLGSGTTMRLRGTTTINGNAQPLIVVNDHIFELPEDATKDIDFGDLDNEEQFSTLLNVNPEDIQSIEVLKDASTAKWGAKGSNGVIEIKLRRGQKGKTNVTFSYKFNGTWQPDGYKMLDGDGYTMMLKEAYFNPQQIATSMPELDYNQNLTNIYGHYSNNTDWIDAVRQFGKEHKWYVTLSGGGEKATFRVSAGYDKSSGSIIAQNLDRFTTQTALDYYVSDRIKFTSNISLTFTNNHKNNPNDILARAYKAMPNMSIDELRAVTNNGVLSYEPTGNYFNMLPLNPVKNDTENRNYTSYNLYDMFLNGNPVAYAYGGQNLEKQYNLTPQFALEYKLLGKDNDHTQLNYMGDVQLNVYNTSNDKYLPAELRNMDWRYGGDSNWNHGKGKINNQRNNVGNSEYKSLEFTTRHNLAFYPHINNEDWTASILGQWEMKTGQSSNLSTDLWNVPNGITDPTVVALLQGAGASNNEWRETSFYVRAHGSYKSKYNLDFSIRWDGSTAFGTGSKFGAFPFIGARWNIIDEPWMKWSKSWLSMLSIRPTWGITGNSGGGGFSQYNKYAQSGRYNGHTIIVPENLSLSSIRWEKTRKMNLGFNLGLFQDLITFELDLYDHKVSDLIMHNQRIASANGFSNLAKVNAGVMRNKGWDLNGSTGWFAKVGKFQMKVRGNIAQNINEIEEMDPLVLEGLNPDENYEPANMAYDELRRVQVGNAFGSIYGLRFKGVYRYDYEHCGYTQNSIYKYGYAEVDENGVSWREAQDKHIAWGTGTGYDKDGNPINTAAAAARRGEDASCPIAYDPDGNMLTDQKGDPLHMYYCYNRSNKKEFQGGDVIYEDVNHDGQIDRLDVVYLGNSNPICNGGFGFTLKWDRLQLNTGFNFRVGCKIVNTARQSAESMRDNNNQSFATTWRWRKNGDITEIPRALSAADYASWNALPNDRYVENGDYLRLQYVQLSYDLDPKILKKWGVRNLKLYASANNLFVWSKYTGTDPEVAPSGWSKIAIDGNRTPRPLSFTGSINLGF